MNELIKAKVIIELLDDRKYSVLSSFTDSELSKLNNVNLEELNSLSSSQINSIISEFLTNVESHIAEKSKENEDESNTVPEKAMSKNISKSRKKEVEAPQVSISDKIQEQPTQLLACLIHQLDDEKKEFVLSNLSDEKKTEIEAVSVENTPISAQVIYILKQELELA